MNSDIKNLLVLGELWGTGERDGSYESSESATTESSSEHVMSKKPSRREMIGQERGSSKSTAVNGVLKA